MTEPCGMMQGSSRILNKLIDRKSTRLNSSHTVISYAVFCLKKKINNHIKAVTHKVAADGYMALCQNSFVHIKTGVELSVMPATIAQVRKYVSELRLAYQGQD